MTDHELERRLRTALDHAAPNDLEGVLSRCETGKGTVIDMTNAVETKKKKNRWAPLAAAACLALVLVGGGGGYYYYSANNAVASLVSLDVNPSIQLEVNKNEKVLSATPMNDDGAEILDGMDLKGTQADVAMYAIIGSLLQHGYVDELANSILITVEDDDQVRGEKLQQELTAQADAALANAQVNGAVLAQTLQNSEELSQKAQEYGISTGKAALIQAIVAGSNNTKTFEDLVGLSINELNLLYTAQAPLEGQTSGNEQNTGAANAAPITTSGSASQSAYIGPEAAKEAALKHAGVSASDATFVEAEYDYDDGRMVYEVEFHVKGTEYDCEIDAQTGEVVKYKTEQNGANTGGSSANTSSFIGESAAKAAALSHAGVSESSTKYCNAWLEYDDGRAECYEVEFMAGNTRYEYKIALTSATVLESERESYGGSGSSGQSTRQSGSQTSGGSGTSSTDIGAEKAKSIALNHAGVSASQTSEMKVEQDWDDGVLEYEVEFKAGGVEYEYTIHGGTGQILKYESDRD
ncbi:PepSY domain-containing protein [Pseudoflavonifractor sp. P01025]|uniref:PepSY domain-containing protein n=1 Tax=Flintibacter porci TaxID=3342383 RepID=UPI0035B67183